MDVSDLLFSYNPGRYRRSSMIDPMRPTVILLVGSSGPEQTALVKTMKETIVDAKVLTFDKVASDPDYVPSVTATIGWIIDQIQTPTPPTIIVHCLDMTKFAKAAFRTIAHNLGCNIVLVYLSPSKLEPMPPNVGALYDKMMSERYILAPKLELHARKMPRSSLVYFSQKEGKGSVDYATDGDFVRFLIDITGLSEQTGLWKVRRFIAGIRQYI